MKHIALLSPVTDCHRHCERTDKIICRGDGIVTGKCIILTLQNLQGKIPGISVVRVRHCHCNIFRLKGQSSLCCYKNQIIFFTFGNERRIVLRIDADIDRNAVNSSCAVADLNLEPICPVVILIRRITDDRGIASRIGFCCSFPRIGTYAPSEEFAFRITDVSCIEGQTERCGRTVFIHGYRKGILFRRNLGYIGADIDINCDRGTVSAVADPDIKAVLPAVVFFRGVKYLLRGSRVSSGDIGEIPVNSADVALRDGFIKSPGQGSSFGIAGIESQSELNWRFILIHIHRDRCDGFVIIFVFGDDGRAVVQPDFVGLTVISHKSIKVIIPVKVSERNRNAGGAAHTSAAVGKYPFSVVQPYLVRIARRICNKRVNTAFGINIFKNHGVAGTIAQVLAAVGKYPLSVVQPHFVGLIAICNKSIDILVAVNISEGHAVTVAPPEALTGIGKRPVSTVQPHLVGLRMICHKGIKIAVVVKVSEGHAVAVISSEILRTLGKIPLSVINPHLVGPVQVIYDI